MMRLLKLIPFVLIFSINTAAFGYEVETHEEMSEHAARRSVLSQDVLSDIGLAGTLDTVVLSDGSINGTVLGWIQYGANHEDDFYYINHFYNPLNGQGYYNIGWPSPVWGIEEAPIAEQEYSLRDARDNFYNGFTLSESVDREINLARTFRRLGHVMHLIQDAGQPQHTRNDSHAMGSLYESFTNESRGSLYYDGYPSNTTLVRFNAALPFWHTLPPQINIQAGQGIAEYSNRSFVSTGTNFRPDGSNVITDPNFPSPAYDPETGFSTSIAEMMATMPTCSVVTTLQGQLTFYGNTIFDRYTNITPDDFNLYTTTLSIFDADLQNASGERFFSLNRFNFCAAQQRLIPRAVGYSGGLLDYFFRGKLEANYTEASGQLTVTIKNISGPANTIHDGTFVLYYDATDGTRKSLAIINGDSVDSAGIVDGANWVITANRPNDVDTSKQNPYMLVYKGIVGTEEAVVGKVLARSFSFIYVAESYNKRIQIFTKSGELVSQFSTGSDDLHIPYGVAVDNDFVYVTYSTGIPLEKFTKDGSLVAVFSSEQLVVGPVEIAVDDNFVYATEINDENFDDIYFRVKVYTKDGVFVTQFGHLKSSWGIPYGVAVDKTYVYVGNAGGEYCDEYCIVKFTKTGAFVSAVNVDSVLLGDAYGVAVDDDYIYVTDNDKRAHIYGKNGGFLFEFIYYPDDLHPPTEIAVDKTRIYVTFPDWGIVQIYTKDGVFVSEFSIEDGLEDNLAGIAVDFN